VGFHAAHDPLIAAELRRELAERRAIDRGELELVEAV
jgi:hypothetical protein